MSTITELFAAAFRNFITDGVSESGIHDPVKSDIRALGAAIDAQKAEGVADLAAIKALTSRPAVVFVKDLDAFYVWESGSSETPDDETVIECTSGTAGRYLVWVPVEPAPPSDGWNGRRQTVAAGPVTSAGLPDLLPSSNPALSLTTTNVSSTWPLVASAAGGWSTSGSPVDAIGYSIANLSWSGLTASRAAATPNFLYVTIAGGVMTPGSTLLAPIYQWGGTPGTANGQFTFNISEMRGYLGNGSTAPQVDLVMIGEAATDGSGVISTVAYAYNGRYDSGYTSTLPAAATATGRNHNIGVIPQYCDFRARCTSADIGYAVGDEISGSMMWTDDGSVNVPFTMSASKLAASVIVQANIDAVHKSTGVRSQLTRASWSYRIVADRGWG